MHWKNYGPHCHWRATTSTEIYVNKFVVNEVQKIKLRTSERTKKNHIWILLPKNIVCESFFFAENSGGPRICYLIIHLAVFVLSLSD